MKRNLFTAVAVLLMNAALAQAPNTFLTDRERIDYLNLMSEGMTVYRQIQVLNGQLDAFRSRQQAKLAELQGRHDAKNCDLEPASLTWVNCKSVMLKGK